MPLYADAPLTTLDAVKAQVKLDTVNAADDIVVERLIVAASDMITQFCARSFLPHRAARAFDALGDHVTATTLDLDEDLLEVIALTNGDGAVLTAGQYVLRGRAFPKWRVELLASAGAAWTYGTDWQEAVTLDGIWGYHEDYGQAWVDTLDAVQDGGLGAGTATLTVGDADGRDARYRTRFAVGQLLRIDSEYLRVVAVTIGATPDPDTLTVLRGVHGTTAAAHEAGASIASFAPMRNVEQACISLVAWLYRNKATAGDEIRFMDGTQVITNKAPSNIRQTLDAYVRVRTR